MKPNNAPFQAADALDVAILVMKFSCSPSIIAYELSSFQGRDTKLDIFFTIIQHTVFKVGSSNTCRLEAHAGFYKLLMKGIFDPYAL